MVDKKQKRMEEAKHTYVLQRQLPETSSQGYPPAHAAMNSAMDGSICEVSVLMLQSPLNSNISWTPSLQHISFWGTLYIQTTTHGETVITYLSRKIKLKRHIVTFSM
jgi:hypothetical protein